MMEHVPTFSAYVEELRKSLVRLNGAAVPMHVKLLSLSANSPSCEVCGIDVAARLSYIAASVTQASTVDCLEDGAWIIVHCGQMRSQKQPSLCDIPFEVKKILSEIPGVRLQVSSDLLLPTS
jgi:hydrogenase maturation factor